VRQWLGIAEDGVMSDEQAAPQRRRNPRGEGDRLRSDIVAAAGRLLSELDSEKGLTVRGIARAAGIAPSGIYQHFTDLIEIVAAVTQDDFARLSADMRAAGDAMAEDDPFGRARARLHAYCRFVVDNPGHYRLMLHHGRLGEQDALLYPRGPIGEVLDSVVEDFTRCAEAGWQLPVPAHRAAVMVFVATHGRVALHHASRRTGTVDEVLTFVDEVLAVFLRRVAAEPA